MAAELMAGIVMDTATFAHPNATPRTLDVSAALVEAGAPLSDISRRLYRSKPDVAAPIVRPGPRSAGDRGRRPDHPLDAARRRPRGDRRDPAHSEGIIDLLAQSEDAEVAILFKEAGEGTRISVRTKPGRGRRDRADGCLRWWRSRAGLRRDASTCRSTTRDARSSPRRSDSSRPSRADRGGREPMDGILVVAKPVGPTSHDVVGAGPAPGRDEAGRSRRDARSVRERRPAGVPGQGDAARRVPPRRSQALPGDGLLRRLVHDRRPRGRVDARRGARSGSGGRRGRARDVPRRDPAASPCLQRDQGRGPTGIRDGSGRADGRAGAEVGDDSCPGACRVGRRHRGGAGRDRGRRVLCRDVHPVPRAGPGGRCRGRRVPRGTDPDRERAVRAWTTRSSSKPSGRWRPMGPRRWRIASCRRTRAWTWPRSRCRTRRSPRSDVASPSACRRARARWTGDRPVRLVDGAGQLLAIARLVGTKLAPDKVLIDAPAPVVAS